MINKNFFLIINFPFSCKMNELVLKKLCQQNYFKVLSNNLSLITLLILNKKLKKSIKLE